METDFFMIFKKGLGLGTTSIIKVCVHTAPLHNAIFVKICLSVSNQINQLAHAIVSVAIYFILLNRSQN